MTYSFIYFILPFNYKLFNYPAVQAVQEMAKTYKIDTQNRPEIRIKKPQLFKVTEFHRHSILSRWCSVDNYWIHWYGDHKIVHIYKQLKYSDPSHGITQFTLLKFCLVQDIWHIYGNHKLTEQNKTNVKRKTTKKEKKELEKIKKAKQREKEGNYRHIMYGISTRTIQ